MENIEQLMRRSRILELAFGEHCVCIRDVYGRINDLLKSPPGTPREFRVSLGPVPKKFYLARKNLFSTLFQSVYHLLEIPAQRRLLYGKLNQLFRVWVTSADNLLDNEDKIVVPVKIAGKSRVMRQVIAVMAADRLMQGIFSEAIDQGVIRSQEARLLSERSLQVLLPSAAEEASEENGVVKRPRPEYVLGTINRLKTGLLFHLPFLGPETIEPRIDKLKLKSAKQGLISFGLGCQILDDIRDAARDLLEKRHNYLLSRLHWEKKNRQLKLIKRLALKEGPQSKAYLQIIQDVIPAAKLGNRLMTKGMITLNKAGLDFEVAASRQLAKYMFIILDLEELYFEDRLSG